MNTANYRGIRFLMLGIFAILAIEFYISRIHPIVYLQMNEDLLMSSFNACTSARNSWAELTRITDDLTPAQANQISLSTTIELSACHHYEIVYIALLANGVDENRIRWVEKQTSQSDSWGTSGGVNNSE